MRTPALCLALAILYGWPHASAQWVPTSLNSGTVYCFADNGANLFAGTSRGVYRTTDNGNTWTIDTMGVGNREVLALAVSGTNLFAGAACKTYWPDYAGGVHRSTDNGTSWEATSFAGQFDAISLAASGTHLFAGVWFFGLDPYLLGIYHSADNGNTWDSAFPNSGVRCLAISGTNVFAGGDGVILSTDFGMSWTEATGPWYVNALAFSGTNIFAGTGFYGMNNGGVYISPDTGTSWTEASTGMPLLTEWGPYPVISSLAVTGMNIFAGTIAYGGGGDGVFLSTNNGTSWTAVNNGLPYTEFNPLCLAVSGGNIFAGTEGGGVWRRPLWEMVTSADPLTSALPHEFVLHQNYPNPFNPSTTIQYELPKSSEVILSVFDMLGREVSVLVNERGDAGVHEVKFEAAGLSSGVYLYRLQADEFVQSKKFVLLK